MAPTTRSAGPPSSSPLIQRPTTRAAAPSSSSPLFQRMKAEAKKKNEENGKKRREAVPEGLRSNIRRSAAIRAANAAASIVPAAINSTETSETPATILVTESIGISKTPVTTAITESTETSKTPVTAASSYPATRATTSTKRSHETVEEDKTGLITQSKKQKTAQFTARSSVKRKQAEDEGTHESAEYIPDREPKKKRYTSAAKGKGKVATQSSSAAAAHAAAATTTKNVRYAPRSSVKRKQIEDIPTDECDEEAVPTREPKKVRFTAAEKGKGKAYIPDSAPAIAIAPDSYTSTDTHSSAIDYPPRDPDLLAMVPYTGPSTPSQQTKQSTSSLVQKGKKGKGKQIAVPKPRAEGQGQRKKMGIVRKQAIDYGNGSYIEIEECVLDRGEGTSSTAFSKPNPSRRELAEMTVGERYIMRHVLKEHRRGVAGASADAAQGKPAKITVVRSEQVIYED